MSVYLTRYGQLFLRLNKRWKNCVEFLGVASLDHIKLLRSTLHELLSKDVDELYKKFNVMKDYERFGAACTDHQQPLIKICSKLTMSTAANRSYFNI